MADIRKDYGANPDRFNKELAQAKTTEELEKLKSDLVHSGIIPSDYETEKGTAVPKQEHPTTQDYNDAYVEAQESKVEENPKTR